jgi:hypothetical protein
MKLDFYPGIRLNTTLRFFYSPAMGVNRHPPGGWTEFAPIDPPKAKARQRLKLFGWNHFHAKHPV